MLDQIFAAVGAFIAGWAQSKFILADVGTLVIKMTAINQVLKKLAEWGEAFPFLRFLAHGVGPKIINALTALTAVIIAASGDGSLSAFEGLQAVASGIIAWGVTWGASDVGYRIIYDWLRLLPRNAGIPK